MVHSYFFRYEFHPLLGLQWLYQTPAENLMLSVVRPRRFKRCLLVNVQTSTLKLEDWSSDHRKQWYEAEVILSYNMTRCPQTLSSNSRSFAKGFLFLPVFYTRRFNSPPMVQPLLHLGYGEEQHSPFWPRVIPEGIRSLAEYIIIHRPTLISESALRSFLGSSLAWSIVSTLKPMPESVKQVDHV